MVDIDTECPISWPDEKMTELDQNKNIKEESVKTFTSDNDCLQQIDRLNRLRKIEAFIKFQMSQMVVGGKANRLAHLMHRLNHITYAKMLAEKQF